METRIKTALDGFRKSVLDAHGMDFLIVGSLALHELGMETGEPHDIDMEVNYCKKNNIEYKGPEEIIKNPAIYKFYEGLIEEKTKSLGQVEKIKKFVLLPAELTQEAGELTPTLKLKRKFIDQKYKPLIDKLYED